MILNPNKYKACIETINRMWEQGQDKEDFEQVISEIAVSTGVEIAAVCTFLESKDSRITPIKESLIKFYKYDLIIPWEQ